MSWHQTIIVGNLGGNPDLKYMQNGTAVCNFSVAVSEKWKDRQTNEQREKTTWYKISVWSAQAESCNQYLKKGSQVMVIGNVSARGYLANDGQPAASLDLTATSVQFLGGGHAGGGEHNESPSDEYSNPSNTQDIPF